MSIVYALEPGVTAAEYSACVGNSALGPTRPLANPERVQAYIDNSNVIITARDADGVLVGLFRGMTDWHWACYCADLAVHEACQGQGIGKGLMNKAEEILGPGVTIALLSLPGAEGFYDRIGLERVTTSAFCRDRTIYS